MKRFLRVRKTIFKALRTVTSFCLIIGLILFHSITVYSDGEKKDVREVIREGFYGFCESIDISCYKVSPSDLSLLFSSIIKDDPYLFFVDTTLSYSFEPGGSVLTLRPSYIMRGEEVFIAWECCREWVRMLAREAMKFENEAQRALYIHDRICLFTEYDKTLESDNIYSLIESGKGTCQAYTLAYIAVLRECGIEAHYVASDTIEHIWNYVIIDGEWYHADLTWDDSASVGMGEISQRHFLLSDKVAEERGHRDWYSFVGAVCESEKYVDFDFESYATVLHIKGDIDHDGYVDLADLLYLRRLLLVTDMSDCCLKCADSDENGTVDHCDTEHFRKKLMGLH